MSLPSFRYCSNIPDVLASLESVLPACDVDLIQSQEKNERNPCDGVHGGKLGRACEKQKVRETTCSALDACRTFSRLQSGPYLIKQS